MALFWIVVVVATWIRSTVNLIAFGNRALFSLSLILVHSRYTIFHPTSVSLTPVTCYHLSAYRFEGLVPTVDGYVYLDRLCTLALRWHRKGDARTFFRL